MRILIIGKKRNGKGEFAKALLRHLPSAVSVGTSEYLVHRLAQILSVTPDEIYSNKEKYRLQLIDLGNDMCEVDPGCLVSICLFKAGDAEHVVVDGVRRTCEFERVREWFDLIIWVHRPHADDGFDNCELTTGDADLLVLNDGGLYELNRRALEIVEALV